MKIDNIVYAVGIYKGGGLQVLKEFIKINKNFYYYFDSRLNSIHYKGIKNYKIVKQNITNIFLENLEFKKKKKNIFFVNGLPPLLNLPGNNFVLYQNLNIFPPTKLEKLFTWLFSSDFLRYIYFKIGYKNVQTWLVLSNIARVSLENNLGKYKDIKNIFFFDIKKKKKKFKKKYDFIYPADLKRHKNHFKIISAMQKLSKENIKPSFLFTLSENEKKRINFDKLKSQINIHNYSDSDNRLKFIKKLQQSKCLFFPSEHETIGLPIIEAFNNNLLVATSNEKYAKQFIKPDILFDCHSIESVKNSIKKIYLNQIKKKNNKMIKFDNFLKKKFFFKIIND